MPGRAGQRAGPAHLPEPDLQLGQQALVQVEGPVVLLAGGLEEVSESDIELTGAQVTRPVSLSPDLSSSLSLELKVLVHATTV